MSYKQLRRAYLDGDTTLVSEILNEFDSDLDKESTKRSPRPLHVICRLLVSQDDIALEEFEALNINDYLDDSSDLSDYGLCLYLFGQGEEALDILLSADLLSSEIDPVNKARLASVYLASANPLRAEHYMLEAISLLPKRYEWLFNLGRIYHTQGRFSEALHFYDQALLLKPTSDSVIAYRSQALVSSGRAGELIKEIELQISVEPERAAPLTLQLSALYESLGMLPLAESLLENLYYKNPSDALIVEAYVGYKMRQEHYLKAGEIITLHQTLYPDSCFLDEYRLHCEIEVGLFDKAESTLRTLKSIKHSHTICQLEALFLQKQERFQEAIKLLEDGLELYPGSRLLRYDLGHLYLLMGDTEKARQLDCEQALMYDGFFLRYMQDLNSEPSTDEVNRLNYLARDANPDKMQRATACFTLADVLQKQKKYSASFRAAINANELLKTDTGYSWKAFRRNIVELTEYFSMANLARLRQHAARFSSLRSIPIFVVGMPRSGTSLTEQILSSHPDIEGKGELGWITRITKLAPSTCGMLGKHSFPRCLDYFDNRHLNSAREYYLHKSKPSDQATFYVDKMPHNFMYIPLISLLFPESPIICLNRDPYDIAVSCYYQNFSAFTGAMGFSYDLDWIGRTLQDYEYIIGKYSDLHIPNMYEVSYELLVSDPQQALAPVLSSLDLQWDDSMLDYQSTRRAVATASIRQVRQPLYKTSIKKWKRYEEFLAPLMDAYSSPYSVSD